MSSFKVALRIALNALSCSAKGFMRYPETLNSVHQKTGKDILGLRIVGYIIIGYIWG
jgi:hypothetical protein